MKKRSDEIECCNMYVVKVTVTKFNNNLTYNSVSNKLVSKV